MLPLLVCYVEIKTGVGNHPPGSQKSEHEMTAMTETQLKRIATRLDAASSWRLVMADAAAAAAGGI